jgi:SAM-dependent methyltransferase
VHHPGYRAWVVGLVRLAREHGLGGSNVLDVGCGTGLSAVALADVGFAVTGCDPSPEMLAVARERLGETRLVAAGLPELPCLGEFDLVVALNDVLDHVLDDVNAAIAAMAANLGPAGLLLFDSNTLATFRGFFASEERWDRPDATFAWRGLAPADLGPGEVAEGTLTALTGDGRRSSTSFVQRHHPDWEIRDALGSASLSVLAVLGQHADGRRDGHVDELVHRKRIYLARRA